MAALVERGGYVNSKPFTLISLHSTVFNVITLNASLHFPRSMLYSMQLHTHLWLILGQSTLQEGLTWHETTLYEQIERMWKKQHIHAYSAYPLNITNHKTDFIDEDIECK